MYCWGGVASDDSRERDGDASVGAVHAVAVGVAARAMDGGASMMGFLLPSFSRRDNLVKYDTRMISPQHTRHVEACRVLCTTQQSTTIKKKVMITKYLVRL